MLLSLQWSRSLSCQLELDGSVLDNRLFAPRLNTNTLWIRDQNLLVVIEPELTVNDGLAVVDLLDLVRFEQSLLDLFEVPSDQIWASRADDTCVLTCGLVKVVEAGWGKIDRAYFVFGEVLDMELELPWKWFLLAHAVLKSCLAI